MHRQRRPRRGIDRIVVDRMDPAVERRQWISAVDEEEVDLVDHRRDQHQRRQVDGMIGPAQPRAPSHWRTPQHEDFDRGPQRDGDEEAAQEIVEVLAFEPEHVRGVIGGEICALYLNRVCLLALDVVEAARRCRRRRRSRRRSPRRATAPSPSRASSSSRHRGRQRTSRAARSPCGTRSRETDIPGSSSATLEG